MTLERGTPQNEIAPIRANLYSYNNYPVFWISLSNIYFPILIPGNETGKN
jgi:hypothetical protein